MQEPIHSAEANRKGDGGVHCDLRDGLEAGRLLITADYREGEQQEWEAQWEMRFPFHRAGVSGELLVFESGRGRKRGTRRVIGYRVHR